MTPIVSIIERIHQSLLKKQTYPSMYDLLQVIVYDCFPIVLNDDKSHTNHCTPLMEYYK